MHGQQNIKFSVYAFIVATCFDLFRLSSGYNTFVYTYIEGDTKVAICVFFSVLYTNIFYPNDDLLRGRNALQQ